MLKSAKLAIGVLLVLAACAPDRVSAPEVGRPNTVNALVDPGAASVSVTMTGPSVVPITSIGALFQANVSGGRQPYVYLWHAFGAGVAITQFQVAESADYFGALRFSAKQGGGMPINIDVTVTDANGNSASAYRTAVSGGSLTSENPCIVNPRLPQCLPGGGPK